MESKKQKAIIYAIKSGGNTCHYIGKTIHENASGDVNKSAISCAYANEGLVEVFESHKEDISIEPIKRVDAGDWYDEKLQEVVNSYKEDNPLLNAQWMLDGKRGYWEGTGGFWEGKTRDPHTLHQLSVSKYIRVYQYDGDGNLIKVWNGAKEAALQVFGDYEVIRGSSDSAIYHTLNAKTLKGRFKQDSYWYRESELRQIYKTIPDKLDIEAMRVEEKRRSVEHRKNQRTEFCTRYTVNQLNDKGEVIREFDNVEHCAFELKVSASFVRRICKGKHFNTNYLLAYGDKKQQAARISYPSYEFQTKPSVRPPKVKMSSRTYREILHYKGEVLLRTYEGMTDAKKKLGFTESRIRRLCETQIVLYNRRLEWGEKKTVLTPVK